MKNKITLAYLSIIFSMICWSLSFVWIKIVFEAYDPITIVLLRLLVSSAILFPVDLLLKRIKKIERKDIKWFLLLSLFEPFLYFLGESFGLQHTSSTLGSVIISTIPLFCPIAGYFIYKERITKTFTAGLFISISGVAAIIVNRDLTIDAPLIGIALLSLAVVSAVGYSIVLKKVAHKYKPYNIIAWQNLVGALYFMPLFFYFDWSSFKDITPSREVIVALVELAIFASSLAFIFFTYSMNILGIAKTNIFCNLMPVFTAIFAYFILGDIITAQQIIGIVVVVSGLIISQIDFRQLRAKVKR